MGCQIPHRLCLYACSSQGGIMPAKISLGLLTSRIGHSAGSSKEHPGKGVIFGWGVKFFFLFFLSWHFHFIIQKRATFKCCWCFYTALSSRVTLCTCNHSAAIHLTSKKLQINSTFSASTSQGHKAQTAQNNKMKFIFKDVFLFFFYFVQNKNKEILWEAILKKDPERMLKSTRAKPTHNE